MTSSRASAFMGLFIHAPGHGWVGSWSPGIGDPNFVGWLTVVAYLVSSSLCFWVYRGLRAAEVAALPADARRPSHAAALAPVLTALTAGAGRIARIPLPARLRALWLGLAVGLLLLGINKQLDLQTALTEGGRLLALSGGWYEARRKVQAAFILGVVLAGVWLLRSVVRLAQGSLGELGVVLVGAVYLVCFVAVRAASFHHIDELLGTDLAGFKLNWLLELGGNALVIFGAARALRRRRASGLS